MHGAWLKQAEEEILSGLKDFQRATVDRVIQLFCQNHQRKVLVADEVGLGKTLVAKGVIARLARKYYRDGHGEFRVVYICSNHQIARQNLEKLDIGTKMRQEEQLDRLSMQSLRVFQQKQRMHEEQGFIHLNAMTPGTSFYLTQGQGKARERAYIFAVLENIDDLSSWLVELEKILALGVKSWENRCTRMRQELSRLPEASRGEIFSKVLNYLQKEGSELLTDLLGRCQEVWAGKEPVNKASRIIVGRLRHMMANISLDFLHPDLVIMDEFQRFRSLITADSQSEMEMLSQRFLEQDQVHILLLSATPYKLYATLEEIDSCNGEDEHFKEFWELIAFLFRKNPDRYRLFQDVWQNYALKLRLLEADDWNELIEYKQQAESLLYETICRTERMQETDTGKAMLGAGKAQKPLEVREEDIREYLSAHLVAESLAEHGYHALLPVEYFKSVPFLLSFMDDYQLKKELNKAVPKHPDLKRVVEKNRRLWVKKVDFGKYRRINFTNARLRRLESEAFAGNAALLLWVPPSLPYYQPGGPFQKAEGFSKILVFSAWTMVPRMIATLISYEAERLTIGSPSYRPEFRQEGKKSYFHPTGKRRFPHPRLEFRSGKTDSEGDSARPESMSLFTLLYPSLTLGREFHPAELAKNVIDEQDTLPTLKELEHTIRQRLLPELDKLQADYPVTPGASGVAWYWAAPFLLDLRRGHGPIILQWIDAVINERRQKGVEQGGSEQIELLHLEKLRRIVTGEESPRLGSMPKESVIGILARQILGSPAVSALRTLLVECEGDVGKETGLMTGDDLADVMANAYAVGNHLLRIFNGPEAIAIVDLKYGKKLDAQHWQNVLHYCVDGNLQAVLDEYRHMLVSSYGWQGASPLERIKKCADLICQALGVRTATYRIDTQGSFLQPEKQNKIGLRSHYAVGYFETRDRDGEGQQRTEQLQVGFNSPFRPFVMATTSIGQEGLDFHYYCRKVMHWNLPSNPVELEQREGRVNRFKNLALRQNIADQYAEEIGSGDSWTRMFQRCREEEEQGGQCELVPYWYMGNGRGRDNRFHIERLVPQYPFSKDQQIYERLARLLSIYRISMGQTRQEELLEYILLQLPPEQISEVKTLFMNLSPYLRQKEK